MSAELTSIGKQKSGRIKPKAHPSSDIYRVLPNYRLFGKYR